MMNSSLITAAIKTLLVKIRNFKEFLANFERASITIENTSSSTDVKYSKSVISKEKSSKISISFLIIFYEIISDLKSENSKFFELFTSSKKSQNNQKIDEKILFTQITFIVERIFSKTRTSDRLIERASERVQTKFHIVRVKSKKNSFQFSHLTHLRHLFITQLSHLFIVTSVELSLSQISEKRFVNLFTKTILSEEYFLNAFSIVFRYQSLQNFVQRNINLDFLKSILSNAIRSRSQTITKRIIESISTSTSQDRLISTESQETSIRFKSNEKILLQEKITMKSNLNHFSIQFTTSFKKQQHTSLTNSFFSFSILSFDLLFHQFRSSFSSNSFTSSIRSILSSKLSIQFDSNFSRIQKLKESIHSSSNIDNTDNFFEKSDSFTSITSVMSISEENAASSMFNLTQQNIQEIALFMFNLFTQNVQSQTQAKIAKTINETIINIVKKNVFRVFDVEFFDSQLNSSYDSDDVVQIERDLYYKNIYFFVKRVKDVVIMFDVEIVRTNLSICLRESTQI